jgi:uncharacterized membrane protein YfcA
MNPETLIIVGAAYFFAAFAKGTTGLGFSTACLPLLALAIGLKSTLPLLIIPSLASNVIVMREAGQFRASVRRFWPLFIAAAPGLAVGLALLAWLDQRYAAAVLGVVLFGYAVFALRTPDLHLPARLERPLAPVVGFLNGTVNGLTGSQVMPVLPYLLALRLDRDLFVQAINCAFTFSSILMAIGLSTIGLMTVETALISALGLIPVYIGVKMGGVVRRRLSADVFRKLVLYMLMLASLLLLIKAV